MSICPRICIIGAGISGICSGVQLKKNGLTNFRIFDENEEVGGTWLVNTYPGCACDIGSGLYSFSFHPNPNWSCSFASQPEILEYMKDVAQTHNLYEHIKFHHQVKGVSWDQTIQKWRVVIYDKKLDSEFENIFEIIIGAVGALRYPNIPKEFESFKGPLMHSARWDSSIKLDKKTVGVVGSGASAVQIIPEIAKSVKNLIVYQRHPAWVYPKVLFKYPAWTKWLFRNFPITQKLQRFALFLVIEMHRPAYNYKSFLNKVFTVGGKMFLKSQVGHDQEMLKKLRPNHVFGNKMFCQSNEYFSSMLSPNVQLIRSDIAEVKEHSIVTRDGVEKQMDVLILATGFKVQDFFAPLTIKGKDGVDVMEVWKAESPKTYLGIVSSVMPNYFMIFGYNSGSANNSAIFSIECQVHWTVKVIQEIIRRQSKGICVKQDAEREYMQQIQEGLKSTVWHLGESGSWYKNTKGEVTIVNPSNRITYWNQTRRPDFTTLNFY